MQVGQSTAPQQPIIVRAQEAAAKTISQDPSATTAAPAPTPGRGLNIHQ